MKTLLKKSHTDILDTCYWLAERLFEETGCDSFDDYIAEFRSLGTFTLTNKFVGDQFISVMIHVALDTGNRWNIKVCIGRKDNNQHGEVVGNFNINTETHSRHQINTCLNSVWNIVESYING